MELREKLGSSCRSAGLEQTGSAWQGCQQGQDGGRGRAGMGEGAGQGREDGGTCVFLHKNVLRNRLERRF